MIRNILLAAAAAFVVFLGCTGRTGPVDCRCHSRNYQYDECWAGVLKQPQLIHQISSSACILNRTWGYNPKSKYIWVGQGCSGVFADVAGYHHGRGDGFDAGARMYDHRGHDVGAMAAGAVLGALVEGMTQDRQSNRHHTTTNYIYQGGDKAATVWGAWSTTRTRRWTTLPSSTRKASRTSTPKATIRVAMA